MHTWLFCCNMPWQKVTAFLAPQHLVELIKTECNSDNSTALGCYNTQNKTTRTQNLRLTVSVFLCTLKMTALL